MRFWTPQRIRLVCLIAIALFVFSAVQTYFQDQDQSSALKRGDFPAFYSAAAIISQGQGERLYDTELQRQIQNKYWPSLKGTYLMFAYPPFIAAVYSPLSYLSPQRAKASVTLLMIFFLSLSIYFWGKLVPLFKEQKLGTLAFFLSFLPVSLGVLGGQNVSLSMFFYTMAIYAFSQKNKMGEYLCGVFLGLWLFKPHYALLSIAFFIIAGRWRIFLGAVAAGFGDYLLGVSTAGLGWPREWVRAIQFFSPEDFKANSHVMVSLIGALKALQLQFDFGKYGRGLIDLMGVGLSGGIFLWVASRFWAARWIRDSKKKQAYLLNSFYLVGPAAVLISQHSLFYDLGLCILPCAKCLELKTDRSVRSLMLLTALTAIFTAYRTFLPVTPLFLLALGSFLFVFFRTKTDPGIRR